MRRSVALLGVTLASVALTACGGGVKKASFVTKADQACAASTTAAAAVAKPTNLPDLATASGTLATAADGQAAALRTVKAPKSDKAVVDGVITAIGDVGGAAKAVQEAAGKTDDAVTAKATTELKAKATSASAQASAYGLGVCAKGLEAPVNTIFEGGRAVVKAGFVAKADALCAAGNRKVDALASPTSLATAARYLASYLPIEEKLFADIKALVVPPGDETSVSEMLGAQDKVIAKDKEMLAAAQARNQRQFDALDEEEASLITAANSKFDDFGLKSCGTLSNF